MAANLLADPTSPRHRVLSAVAREPGLHFRALSRATNLPAGQLRHHLDRLRREGYLVEVEDGGYTRFFLVGNHSPRLRPAMAALGRSGPRRIAKALLLGPQRRAHLRGLLHCADSTLSFHLARLLEAGLVVRTRDGSGARYALADPAAVREALLAGAGAAGEEPEEPLDMPPAEGPRGPPEAAPQVLAALPV
jgi:DNA-binding transcriptional ArsR family regulator